MIDVVITIETCDTVISEFTEYYIDLPDWFPAFISTTTTNEIAEPYNAVEIIIPLVSFVPNVKNSGTATDVVQTHSMYTTGHIADANPARHHIIITSHNITPFAQPTHIDMRIAIT